MTVIVPDAGQFSSFERSLDPALLARIVGSLSPSDVTLALPKLQLKDKIDLVPALKALGMTDAFDNADFSGITGNRTLAISQVVHQATVTVDEEGTEAAAATGIAFAQSACAAREPQRRPAVPLPHPRSRDRLDPVRRPGYRSDADPGSAVR